jgi:2Fe-2S ferredoxin
MRDPLQLARRFVPGSGAPTLERVGAGLLHESYRVERDGGCYSLRVSVATPAPAGPAPPQWERRVLQGAAAAGIAPGVEYCDPTAGILVCRWIAGRGWSPEDVRSPLNQGRFADLVRRIHALPLPRPIYRVTPARWIAHYRECLASARAGVSLGLAALAREADARVEALAAHLPVEAVLCHGDLHPANLIDGTRGLVVLDWEYAHASDPFWDLAVWSSSNEFDAAKRSALLANYAHRPATPVENDRFAQLTWLYEYTCLLWNEVWAVRRPDLGPPLAAVWSESLAARLSGVNHAASVVAARNLRQTTRPDCESPGRGNAQMESSMARMTVVDRDGKEHEVDAKPGLKVMEILRELDYGVAAICGGLCSCATCHVYVDESWADRLPKRQSDEQDLLTELSDYRPATSRLSCQIEFTDALSGLKVTIAQDT